MVRPKHYHTSPTVTYTRVGVQNAYDKQIRWRLRYKERGKLYPIHPVDLYIASEATSRLEAEIAGKLRLNRYKFNFEELTDPKYIPHIRVDLEKTIDLENAEILFQRRKRAIRHRPRILRHWVSFHLITTLKTRYRLYKEFNKFPKDFAQNFPYLDCVLRDMYITHISNIMYFNNMQMQYKKAINQYFDILTAFQSFYQIVVQKTNLKEFLQSPESKSVHDTLFRIEEVFDSAMNFDFGITKQRRGRERVLKTKTTN